MTDTPETIAVQLTREEARLVREALGRASYHLRHAEYPFGGRLEGIQDAAGMDALLPLFEA